MASGEVQPVTAHQPIEGELLNVLTTSNEQILNLISPTHLPDEENFDADFLLVAVEHEHQKYCQNCMKLSQSDEEDMENLFIQKKEDMENLEEKMSIASFNSEEDVENPKEKGQENLEKKLSKLRDSFNPQLLCILKQLSSEMACKAPSVEVIMSILNKLSNYSWEAKLLLILAAYGLNYEDFLDIPNNVPATIKHQKLQGMLSFFDDAILDTLHTMKYFLELKKVTKDEPALLLDVAGDISVGVYWIILACTTRMFCLASDKDKTHDLSPLDNKIRSIFYDLFWRMSKIDRMYRERKLKELFADEQIVNMISETHLPDEENFDADSLIVVVEKICDRTEKIEIGYHDFKGVEEVTVNLEEKMSIANFKSEEDVENPKEKDQENLEEKVSRLRYSINPQLLCIVEQLLFEMACEAPTVEVIMSILNKLSNYSWDAKLVLILAAYALNFENFLDIPNNVPAPLKDLERFGAIINTLYTMKHFWKVKKDTKDEPALLSNVAGDIPEGVYWIIVTCTTHMCCLTSDEDKTQDLSPLINKIRSIFSDLGMRISTIGERYKRRKLRELFAKDAMQPLIDGSTNEQVSIDVLKEKNILLFISGLNIHRNDKSDLMSIYNGIKKKGDQYKIVWIPIVEQWTNNLRRKFEMLQSKMPWYIVQYFSAVAAIKFIEERYNNKPIVLLMNPQGDVENEGALDLIQRSGMRAFPFTPRLYGEESAYWRTSGPYEIEEYTFLCGGKDKRWIEQFSQKVNVVVEDQLIQEVNIIIELCCVGKGRRQRDFDKEIQELLRSLRNKRRWAVFMTNFSEVISKDGVTILQVLEAFEEWKVNVRERGFQICFKEYHDRLLPTGSQPSASRNV